MAPPKYDLKKLNDNNQFLCSRGQNAYVQNRDIESRPTEGYQSSYYSNSRTNVPFEILNTGNIEVINEYVRKHENELNAQEKGHLNERMDVMRYFNTLEEYYRTTPRTGVQPMTLNADRQKVLPGVVLDRKQDTSLGCWSCAFSMLLKGRGVDIDQKLIRRYRPEFVKGHEINSVQQTDIMNSNEMSEIYQYSSLIDKVCPNTKMCKMDKNPNHGATRDQILAQVEKALREKNAPVAFCNGYHWTTIVGISDDNSTFYVVDSQKPGGKIDNVPVNTYLSSPNAEFVWLEDIVLDKDGKSAALPENRFRVDPASGAVVTSINSNFKIEPAKPSASDMTVRGNHILDPDAHMEYYVPTMIRDYGRKYEEQKTQSDLYHRQNGGFVPPEPKERAYTMAKNFSKEAVIKDLEKRVEKNVIFARKQYLKNRELFEVEELDNNMEDDRATRCYYYAKEHPDIKEIPLEIDHPEVFEGIDEAQNQNDLNPPVEEAKAEAAPVEAAPKQEKNEFSIFEEDEAQPAPQVKVPASAPAPEGQTKNEFSIFPDEPKPEPEKKENPLAEPPKEQPQHRAERPQPVAAPVRAVNPAERAAMERKGFAALGKELENAKTTVNSKQYKALTDTIKALGNEKLSAKMTPEERKKLMVIAGITIADYISHKAKDGVKPNVFRKLAAVEAAGRYLDKALAPHRNDRFTLNNKKCQVSDISRSLEEQYNAADFSSQKRYNELTAYNGIENKLAKFRNPNCRRYAEHTNSCMNKIILNAVSNNYPTVKALDRMRSQFAEEEFVMNELSIKKELPQPKKDMGAMHL